MASLAGATSSFLSQPHRKRTIIMLRLELCLIGSNSYSRDIGLLVVNAIDSEIVKELDLAIINDKFPEDSHHEVLVQHARDIDGFFSACPGVLRCLTRLHLHNVRFAERDMNRLLFGCCKQLRHLSLNHCDTGDRSVWTIDVPDSNLRVLEVLLSSSKRTEVLCLPKLERLCWKTWLRYEAPLCFGSVPSLQEFRLMCGASLSHQDFSLSQVLHGATNIQTLTLDFSGERIWMEPEGKQLCTAFGNLKKLSLRGIFMEFDMFWTLNLIEAAPSVEIFDVEVLVFPSQFLDGICPTHRKNATVMQMFEHPCRNANKRRIRLYGASKVKPSWKIPEFRICNKWRLKELQFAGFRPLLHLLFVSAVMDRAPELKTVLLTDGKQPCNRCDTMVTKPPPIGGIFPTDRDEQEAIVKQLRDRVWSSARIIFSSSDSTVVL